MNTTKNKTVIVTGVTGQMGSYLVDYLADKGVDVIGTVRRLSVPNKENLNKIKNQDKLTLEAMDLSDSHSIDSLVQKYKPDYFINCAANSFVGSSWDFPEQHMDINAIGVLRQLEAIRKHSPNTRYFNFGSSEEFGDIRFTPQDETHPLRPRSPYGASKCAARHLVKVYRESYNLYAIQGWHFNYESERRGEEFVTRKITKAVARIKKSIDLREDFKSLELGNLNAKRDWSHCLDIADGVWKMLNQEKQPRMQKMCLPRVIKGEESVLDIKKVSGLIKEYVLASGETHTIREFVENSFDRAGFSKEECYWSGEGVNETYNYEGKTLVKINEKFFRPAEVSLLLGDPTKAEEELGWERKTDFIGLCNKMVDNDLIMRMV